jgi:hypothetical protein
MQIQQVQEQDSFSQEQLTNDEVEVDETDTSTDEVEEGVEEDTEEAPEEEWVPDYKVKVLDNEYEFDDFLKPIVTKENYHKVKELYEKAHGLDHVKSKYVSLKNEYEPIVGRAQQYEQAFSFIQDATNKKDYDTLFKELNIPKEDILNVALKYAQYQNLPPEQKIEYDKQVEAQQRLSQLEYQNSVLQQNFYTQQVQARASELNGFLNKADIQEVVKGYDAATQAGSFQNLVVMMGQQAARDGKDITVEEAVSRAMQLVPKTLSQRVSGGEVNQAMPSRDKPSIPKVRSIGNSPVSRKITSIDQLRKLANQLSEQE